MYQVIIVEDEMFVRIGLEHSIDWREYQMEVVASVSSGKEALQAYNEYTPALIITDIKMAGMSGLELIEEIRKSDGDVKFIIVSGLEDFKMAQQAMKFGVSSYLVKSDMSIPSMQTVLEKVFDELEAAQYPNEAIRKENKWEQLSSYLSGATQDNHFLETLGNEKKEYLISYLEIDANGFTNPKEEGSSKLVRSINDVALQIYKNNLGGFCLTLHDFNYLLFAEYKSEQEHRMVFELLINLLASYFNIKARVLITPKFKSIRNIKENYDELESKVYKLFYSKKSIVRNEEVSTESVSATLQDQVEKLVNYYRENFDRYATEFEKYKDVIAKSNPQDISTLKEIFIQWVNMFMTIMYLKSERLSHYHAEIGESIRQSHTLYETVSIFLDFMAMTKEKFDETVISAGLLKAIEYINLNLSHRITLLEVANHINYSSGYLSYLFKNELDTTFTEFVTNSRTSLAKKMLLQTSLKSYQIAEKVGFGDSSYFHKVFKKATGQTPNEYKKANYVGDAINETEDTEI